MMYQVPQFIEVEDKIVGPLTFKQVMYLFGGGGACFLTYKLLPSWLAFPLMALFGGFALALAFFKVNERPFITMLEAALVYFFSGKLFIWAHDYKKQEKDAQAAAQVAEQAGTTREQVKIIPKITEGKLRDIAWSLDIPQNNQEQQK